MAWNTGFWVADDEGTVARMNHCLLEWGPVADRPAAAAANKGVHCYTTDEGKYYYSDGAAWQETNTGGIGIYGDGSDGDATIAAPTTLTRDMFYNTLAVNDVLTTDGFRIFVKGALTNASTIENNGGDAVAAAKGAGAGAGSTAGGRNGGDGKANANGDNGTSNTDAFGGAGGAGGDAGGNTGGTGGTITAPAAITGGRLNSISLLTNTLFGQVARTEIHAGAGGGGGAGDATPGTGGGGGGGGGTVLIVARQLDNSGGTIQANGGAGANGVAANGGGGGGGGGGHVALLYNQLLTGTEEAAAGALGTGNGTGNNGVAGSAGTVDKLPCKG